MFRELLERNANRVIDGRKVKFDGKHIKDISEIMDTVAHKGNDIKLVSQKGDHEVSFDISNDAKMYAKLAKMYDLNQFDIDTNGNVVTLSVKEK